jgi:hypothetical protein
MGLRLEAAGKMSIWRKRKEMAASVWPSIHQVKRPARLSAFPLQSSPLGLRCVLCCPRSMNLSALVA